MSGPAQSGSLERVEAWGMASASMSLVFRPSTVEHIGEAFEAARAKGITVALKGAGNSYGDAFQNAEGAVIDLSRMNRILDWDPNEGAVRCEPGVTVRDLWRYAIGDGWWPPVVSGTSNTTLGGALAANIHGKNSFKAGPIGEHVLSFDLLTPGGLTLTCSAEENHEVFYAAIGGFGLLGAITSVRLQMKRIASGLVRVEAISVGDWRQAFEAFQRRENDADYLVGWIDCLKSGSDAGRGLVHVANYLRPGEDAHPEESLKVEAQESPDTALGWLARSKLHRLMKPFMNKSGMRLVNSLKYRMGSKDHGRPYTEPIARFNFLLDSLPDWKRVYRPGALIQYQCFIPAGHALEVFDEITKLSRDRGLPPFLAVMKRHRPDAFLLSHAVDGYSLALDYPVTRRNRDWLWRLAADMDEMVLDAGGRFYFAKDSTLRRGALTRYLGEEPVRQFLELKERLDPRMILQTELSKRVFGRLEAAGPSVVAAGGRKDEAFAGGSEERPNRGAREDKP